MNAVVTALSLLSVRVCLGLSTALGLTLLAIPLFAVQGVESALALGIGLPPLCALTAARLSVRARAGQRPDALRLAAAAVTTGWLLLLPPALILALNALRVPNCAPLEGAAFMLLGPGAAVTLASLCGAAAGALPLGAGSVTALAVLIPLCDMARGLYELYASPAVFAYGHLFGYFPGSLYDDLVAIPTPLLSLRAVSLALAIALVSGLRAFYDPGSARLRWRSAASARRSALLCAVASVLCAGSCAQSDSLGHTSSVAHIAQVLGAHQSSRRCELLLPRELRRVRRDRLAADCDFRVEQLERWFGLRQPGKVRVILFRSPDEKRALMGAARTNIAKPWRREIYLQDDVWPHPVMAHELAHILAGNTGIGPMRVTGKLGGLLPDFALIEGVAVAAAWASSSVSGITPHQWARAMYELGIAPSLRSVAGAGFLGQQHRLAYMFAGSLLRYIADTHGSEMLRRIYRSGDVAGELGIGLPELERRYRAYVMAVELPDSVRALAKQRFSGSSILSSVCPHVKAQLRAELEGQLLADDAAEAEQTCQRLLAIDPAESAVRATLLAVRARRGDEAGAQRELAALQGPPPAPPPLIAGAMQALGDEAFRNHDYARAQRTYRELIDWPNDRDALRQLQVRALAFEGSARQRELLFALLVGEPGAPADPAYAVHLARELRREREDGLPYYLEARQLFTRERFGDAAGLLHDALQRGLPSEELRLEALRLAGMSRFGAGDLDAAATVFHELDATPDQLGLQAEGRDWLQRIAAQQRTGSR